MATQAALGHKALQARDYAEATKQYTIALKSSQSPLWLIDRSIAYQRSNLHGLALKDAENAVVAAQARARRELMATAQFRRAIALHGLGRIGDARMCFIWARKLNEKEKGLSLWQAKIAKDYDSLPEDAEARTVTVKETPDKSEDVAEGGADSASIPNLTSAGTGAVAKPQVSSASASPVITQTPKEKIRNEWFQSSSKITITIFAKGVPKEKAEIEIGNRSLHVQFPTANISTYDYTLLPLYSEIDPSQSSFTITPNKIEISLHKVSEGLKWSELEGAADSTSNDATTKSAAAISSPNTATATATTNKPPSYPTSSRKGVKDWDAVAADELKKASLISANEPAATDAVDEDDEGGDAVNSFFQKLYKGADPDTKRAMMKSFVESNGTALSTNWSEVGKKPVETSPPEGVVAKKWES